MCRSKKPLRRLTQSMPVNCTGMAKQTERPMQLACRLTLPPDRLGLALQEHLSPAASVTGSAPAVPRH